MSEHILWYIHIQYSVKYTVKESSPALDSRVAPIHPVLWNWKNILSRLNERGRDTRPRKKVDGPNDRQLYYQNIMTVKFMFILRSSTFALRTVQFKNSGPVADRPLQGPTVQFKTWSSSLNHSDSPLKSRWIVHFHP